MSAVATPNNGLPTNPPRVTKDWTYGTGESIVREWSGLPSDISTEYDAQVAAAQGGSNIAQVSQTTENGRARLIVRFGRTGVGLPGYPDDVAVVEELYAVDVMKDINTANHYVSVVDGGAGLSDDKVAFVNKVSAMCLTEDEITTYAFRVQQDVLGAWANWTNGMKSLRYHLLRGADTYYETGFILRRSQHAVRTAQVGVAFTGINTVAATDPDFTTPMSNLISALPAGEWLYRPPQAAYLGRGKWRVDQEWHWAKQWSIVYGGTWDV